MKKIYTAPHVDYAFIEKDVITISSLIEIKWSMGSDISKEDDLIN